MLWAHDTVPDYLLGKVQLIATVVFAALFSVFFFIGVIPSANLLLPQLETSRVLDLSLIVYGLSLLIVILSRRLMYACREWVKRRFRRYLAWNLTEIVLVAAGYVLLITLGAKKGLFQMVAPLEILSVRTLLYCLLTLGIPYLLAGMFFAIHARSISSVCTEPSAPTTFTRPFTRVGAGPTPCFPGSYHLPSFAP